MTKTELIIAKYGVTFKSFAHGNPPIFTILSWGGKGGIISLERWGKGLRGEFSGTCETVDPKTAFVFLITFTWME